MKRQNTVIGQYEYLANNVEDGKAKTDIVECRGPSPAEHQALNGEIRNVDGAGEEQNGIDLREETKQKSQQHGTPHGNIKNQKRT
jgi:hypothetical protein